MFDWVSTSLTSKFTNNGLKKECGERTSIDTVNSCFAQNVIHQKLTHCNKTTPSFMRQQDFVRGNNDDSLSDLLDVWCIFNIAACNV